MEKKTDGLFCIDHRTEEVAFQSGIIGIKKGAILCHNDMEDKSPMGYSP